MSQIPPPDAAATAAPALPPPLPWPVRQWLVAFAVFGSLLYAFSFTLVRPGAALAEPAPAVAGAALLAWLAFVATLVRTTRGRVPAASWVDAALLTLRVGMRVLMLGLLLNLLLRRGLAALAPWADALHIAIAIAANLAMLVFFVRRAEARGMPPRRAATTFVAVLDGVFVAAVLALSRLPALGG